VVRRAVRHAADKRTSGSRAGPPTKVDPRIASGLLDARPAAVVAPPAAVDPRRMIESDGLTKRLGGRIVVDDVSFRCEPGTVTGFLGPNGAGKTTTMRLICGLSDPDDGRATILGGHYRDLPNPGRRVGILLDAAAQHDGRRGREALMVSAQLMDVPARRVDELLALVGLDRAAARRRVGQYSLGMRQRLGIAHALLGDPEVLIFDEPANGLDPEGMRWMRDLLRDFADRGGTVLLSSHLLHEVQAVADRLVIIGGGRIVAQGTTTELLAGAGTLVRATDESALGAALVAADLVPRPARDGGFLVEAVPEEVGRAALAGGVVLTHLGPSEGAGLEKLFFDLTSGGGEVADRTDDLVGAAR
jgi:ABC-2 type transport system ATP-binding protein